MTSTLTFWWWGEDEAPGLRRWLEQACAVFKRRHGVTVDLTLLPHSDVLTRFPQASAAGVAPDLHFFWNGIYLVDFVWQGYVRSLDDLLRPEELEAFGGGPQSRVDGRTYRVGWYVIPVCWFANRRVLLRAGVPEIPRTWDAFVEACERVRRAGLTPLCVGDGEGDFSVWWLTHFLTQQLDHPSEAALLALGERDWRDERYSDPWLRLAEIRDRHFLDEEALQLTLWAGLERFNEGRSAFTLGSGPMFNSALRALAADVTVCTAPLLGQGRLAGLPIVDTQGIGISSSSRDPKLAASLLRMLHDEERSAALWSETRLFPADRRWTGPNDGAEPEFETMWRWYSTEASAPYVPNLLPLDLHFQVAAGIGQEVLAGTLDPRESGAEARRRALRWHESDPARSETYRRWVLEAAVTVSGRSSPRGRR